MNNRKLLIIILLPAILITSCMAPEKDNTPEFNYTEEGGDMSQITLNAPTEVEVGKDFGVILEIDTVSNFDAGQFDILFNPAAMEFQGMQDGDIGGTAIPVAIYNMLEPGKLRVILNVAGLPGVSGSGFLATVNFKALKAEEEPVPIAIDNGFINDNKAIEIPSSWEGCVLSFFLRGDINGDGVVDTRDIVYLERIIVGLEPGVPAADLNGDGIINTAELTLLERIIAGL